MSAKLDMDRLVFTLVYRSGRIHASFDAPDKAL